MEIINALSKWYVAGPLIGLFVPFFLLFGSKMFGISSSFDYICSVVFPGNSKENISDFVNKNRWKFYFVIGITIGGWIANFLLSETPAKFLPESYHSLSGYVQLLAGGILVGFGTRYANGCTSGHSITGISTLQKSGIIATIFFFVGGLIMTFLFY